MTIHCEDLRRWWCKWQKKGSYEVHTTQHISNDQGCRLIALSNLLFVCPKWRFSTSSLAIPLGYTNSWAFWSSQASRASYMSIGGFRFIISLRTSMYVVNQRCLGIVYMGYSIHYDTLWSIEIYLFLIYYRSHVFQRFQCCPHSQGLKLTG
mgnify:CR=1 FL=1